MGKRLAWITAWSVILAVSIFVRFADLGNRPMHADEATGARIVAQQLEGTGYAFDPVHFHGPLLSLAGEGVARITGETKWQDLSKSTLRLVPALAGSLMILVPLFMRRELGNGGALAAAALLGTSPLLVYYNRMFIHESLLATLSLLALAVLFKFAARPSVRLSLLAGILVGLMWATRETFILIILSWGIAALLAFSPEAWRSAGKDLRSSLRDLKHLPVFMAAIIVTAGLLYTGFLKHPQAALDALRTYFIYETVPGHEKELLYYAGLLLWPESRGGVLWWEGPVILLAISALGALWVTQRSWFRATSFASRFFVITTLIQITVYSLIPYKTPWLMVVPWVHACIWAGVSMSEFTLRHRSTVQIGAACVFGLVLLSQLDQSLKATGRFASDTRNPYAYVPTHPDVEAVEDWLGTLSSQLGPETLGRVAVVGHHYWPLPWYLRQFNQVGYWNNPETSLQEFGIILAMPDAFQATGVVLAATHIPLPRSLREDVPMMLYLRNDLWHHWMEGEP